MQGRSSRLVHPLEEDLNATTQPPTAWKIQKKRKVGVDDSCTASHFGTSTNMSEMEQDSEAASELGLQNDYRFQANLR